MKSVAIVGMGPAGTTAGRILADAGWKVDIFDRRNHIAGNCFDGKDKHGIDIHRYGPHYFRTNSEELLQWLSKFTDWIPGKYYVRAKVGQKTVPMPVSLSTISQLKNKEFTKEDFEEYLQEQRENIADPKNAEEQCLSLVGKELYEALFKGYTIKQWGCSPTELDPSITARIPLRFNHDEKYPIEKHQVYPKDGYTKMFEKILDHENITISLKKNISPNEVKNFRKTHDHIIYTGAIDEFFEYRFGQLGYRSLKFEWKHFPDREFFQETVQTNYPNDYDYTRSVEIKHVSGQVADTTTVCYEYPSKEGDPYYPLLNEKNNANYKKYAELAQKESQQDVPIHFIGRMAEFRYYNMDHVFLKSMNLAKNILRED